MRHFPIYKQLDSMDCGPTCLRMIAKYYGKSISSSELQKRSFVRQYGTSILGISEAAESIGLRTLSVEIPLRKFIDEAPLPCIVHWNKSHFVVVIEFRRRKILIADPAIGKLSVGHDQFAEKWIAWREANSTNGVALFLEPTPEFQRNESNQDEEASAVQFLFSYLNRYQSYLWQLAIGLFAGSVIQLIFPFLTQSIVDVGISTPDIGFIYIVLAGQLMLTLSRTAVEFLRRWILLHLSTRINIAIISDFIVKLMKLRISFFDQKRIGDILNRIEDHTRIEQFLSSSSLNVVFSLFNFFVFGIVLLIYSPVVYSIFIGGSAVYVLYVLLFMAQRRRLDYMRFSQLAKNQGTLIEIVNGMPDIKLSNSERQKRWQWERIQANIFKVSVGSTRLQQLQEAGGLFINESKNILVTIYAAQSVIEGSITLGMMLAIQYIIGQLNSPIGEFVSFTREYQDAKISVERIKHVHDERDEDAGAYDSPLPVIAQGKIAVNNIKFQYDEPQAPLILDNVTMDIPFGKTTAIVGTSGSGKTTLLKLLLKFYEPKAGTIQVSGMDLAMIHSGSWRSRCGVVLQDGYIFAGSIGENIAMGDEHPDNEKLISSASLANIYGYIQGLPFGFQTQLGDKGAGLSQGQKQRLLIARAIYKNPDFIFLDEATSSLDARNEKIIMTSLRDFFTGKTVVVIAHRLSTVKNADQIIVLDQGKVVERGTHLTLIQQKGPYYDLVRNQLELGM